MTKMTYCEVYLRKARSAEIVPDGAEGVPARGAETARDEAEGDARAEGVEAYSEVRARPDNDVSRRLCLREAAGGL